MIARFSEHMVLQPETIDCSGSFWAGWLVHSGGVNKTDTSRTAQNDTMRFPPLFGSGEMKLETTPKAGASRFAHAGWLRHDKAFHALLGMERFPAEDAIRRFSLLPSAFGEVRMPALFSDGMVLQRNGEIPVWGWESPGQKVTVSLSTSKAEATAGPDGRWKVSLAPLPAGGPHVLAVAGEKNQLTYKRAVLAEQFYRLRDAVKETSPQTKILFNVPYWKPAEAVWLDHPMLNESDGLFAECNRPDVMEWLLSIRKPGQRVMTTIIGRTEPGECDPRGWHRWHEAGCDFFGYVHGTPPEFRPPAAKTAEVEVVREAFRQMNRS